MTRGLTVEDEQAFISLAKSGDTDAMNYLLQVYAPAIKSGARAFGKLIPDWEDALQAARMGVLQAIIEYNPEKCPRLAGMVRTSIQDEMWAAASGAIGSMNIPRTILARYFRVMSDERVGGDVARARAVAAEYQISPETVFSVWAAVSHNYESDMGAFETRESFEATIEDKILAETALAAMQQPDQSVVKARYGFDAYSEATLEEAGALVGLNKLQARQAHARGLADGRKALGLRGDS